MPPFPFVNRHSFFELIRSFLINKCPFHLRISVIRRQRKHENSYLNLGGPLGYKPIIAYFFMAITAVFNSSGVNAFFMITVRGVLSRAIGSSFFSNMLYRFQQKNLMILSEGLDMQNPLAASKYSQTLNSALAQGHPLTEAQQLAPQALYNSTQIQALVVSIKQLIGYMLIVAIVIMVISRFTPFHKTLKVAVPRTGEDMV